jgi:nickel superoxide dismutase
MLNRVVATLSRTPITDVEAHCDGPCGVYDPATARITAEAVVSMTKKILALQHPDNNDAAAVAAYHNTMCRYVAIKEDQAEKTKHELLVLWTDFFKPAHLTQFPDLHDVFWKATKECSYAKQEVSLTHAQNVLDACKTVHEMFWAAKGRDVPWYTAS